MISVTKYVGLNKKTVEWINQYTGLLTVKKIPAADCLATLTAGETEVTHKDGLQETAKTNLKNATKATEGAVTVRYKELSSMIDYIAGGHRQGHHGTCPLGPSGVGRRSCKFTVTAMAT